MKDIIDILLQSYFVFIESELLRKLHTTEYEYLMPKIRELSVEEQNKFLDQVKDTDGIIKSSDITPYLNAGVLAFYKGLLSCFPYNLIPNLLWEEIQDYQRIYIFPFPNTLLNWQKILTHFYTFYQATPAKNGDKIIIKYIQLAFGFTIRELTRLNLSYDESILLQNTKFCGERIGEYCLEQQFHLFKQFETPPLQHRIVEIKEQIAIHKEQIKLVSLFKIPPFGEPGNKLDLPEEMYIGLINDYIEVLKLKAEKLQATIDREEISHEPNLRLERTDGTGSKEQDTQVDFENYLEESYRKKLMPFLKQYYSNQKPEKYGYMLYALVGSKCMPETALNSNQTKLHVALSATFGKIGTRQNLNTAIKRLDPETSSPEDKRQIEEHKKLIINHLKK